MCWRALPGRRSLWEITGSFAFADEDFEIAQNLGDLWLIGVALGTLGTVATVPAKKRALWQDAATHVRRAGDLALCSVFLASQALLELEEEHFDLAVTLLEDAIELCEEIGAPLHLYWAWARSVKPASSSRSMRRRLLAPGRHWSGFAASAFATSPSLA